MKWNIKIYIILLLGVLTTSCSKKEEKDHKEALTEESEHSKEEENQVILTAMQFKGAGIKFGKIEKRNLSNTLIANGILDVPPQNIVSISAPLGGFLKSTDLLQGARVKKGQVIAVLENIEFLTLQQDYFESKNRYEYLAIEYDRQRELSNENVSSTKTFQQITSEYKTLKARLKGLEEKLAMIGINVQVLTEDKITRHAYIYSPIHGFVTKVNVNIGKYVNPTDVMFEIVDPDHLHAELTVFEKDVAKLKEGQKVRFTLPNDSRKEQSASVFLIGREIGSERTIRVHAHLDQKDENLIPGMYIRATIETGETQVNALPENAIVNVEGKKYIFIKQEALQEHAHNKNEKSYEQKAEDQKESAHDEKEKIIFQMIEVKTGISTNGYVEVVLPENFDVNAQVVIQGAYSLISVKNNGEGEGHGH